MPAVGDIASWVSKMKAETGHYDRAIFGHLPLPFSQDDLETINKAVLPWFIDTLINQNFAGTVSRLITPHAIAFLPPEETLSAVVFDIPIATLQIVGVECRNKILGMTRGATKYATTSLPPEEVFFAGRCHIEDTARKDAQIILTTKADHVTMIYTSLASRTLLQKYGVCTPGDDSKAYLTRLHTLTFAYPKHGLDGVIAQMTDKDRPVDAVKYKRFINQAQPMQVVHTAREIAATTTAEGTVMDDAGVGWKEIKRLSTGITLWMSDDLRLPND
jgi:hypothetical protein